MKNKLIIGGLVVLITIGTMISKSKKNVKTKNNNQNLVTSELKTPQVTIPESKMERVQEKTQNSNTMNEIDSRDESRIVPASFIYNNLSKPTSVSDAKKVETRSHRPEAMVLNTRKEFQKQQDKALEVMSAYYKRLETESRLKTPQQLRETTSKIIPPPPRPTMINP